MIIFQIVKVLTNYSKIIKVWKIMGKHTFTVKRMICPNCGLYGEYKLRIRGNHLYVYIDHYNGQYYNKKNYKNCCYFGRFD